MDIRPQAAMWGALAFMAVAGLIAAGFEVDDWTSADLADWVQAIGSLVAVGGAGWIAVWQNMRQERREIAAVERAKRDEKARRLDAMKSVQLVCSQLMHDLTIAERNIEEEKLDPRAMAMTSCPMLDMYADTLRDARLAAPPLGPDALIFAKVFRDVVLTRNFFETLAKLIGPTLVVDADVKAAALKLVQDVLGRIKECHRELQDLLRA